MADDEAVEKYATFNRLKGQHIVRAGQIEEAVAFYKKAFGALEIGRYYAPDENHRLLYVELKVGGSNIVVAEGSDAKTGSEFRSIVQTIDFDYAVAGAVAAGAVVASEVKVENLSKTQGGGGVNITVGKVRVRDPFGFTRVIESTTMPTNTALCSLCPLPPHIPALCSKSLEWMQLNEDALDVHELVFVRTTELHLLKLDAISWKLREYELGFERNHTKRIVYYCRSLLPSLNFHLGHLVTQMQRMIQILRWVEVSLYTEDGSGVSLLIRRSRSKLRKEIDALFSILPSSDSPLAAVWPISEIFSAFKLAVTSVKSLLQFVQVSRVSVMSYRIGGMKGLVDEEFGFWKTILESMG